MGTIMKFAFDLSQSELVELVDEIQRRMFLVDDVWHLDKPLDGSDIVQDLTTLLQRFGLTPPDNLIPSKSHDHADRIAAARNQISRKVRVDATDFQSADDGNTTTYGGTVHIGDRGGVDIEIKCHGTDRDSVTCFDDVTMAVLEALGLPPKPESLQPDLPAQAWPTLDYDAVEEAIRDNMTSQLEFDVWLSGRQIWVGGEGRSASAICSI